MRKDVLSKVPVEALEKAILTAKNKIILNTEKLRGKKNSDGTVVYKDLSAKMFELDEIAGKIENKGFCAGIAGEQSSGKSFLTNVLLGFPVLPMANVVTSSAPVRIKYGEKVKIKIFYYEGDTEKLKKEIDCSKISSEDLASLKKYICTCASAMGLENITYFVSEEIDANSAMPEQLEINVNDARHIAFLWLALLAVYINQNENREHLRSKHIEAVKERELLYKKFGLDPYIDYMIEVSYENALLKEGLIIIDLPGLGANVKKQKVGDKEILSHEQITLKAISNTDSMIFIFNPEMRDAKMEKVIESMMACEAYKQRNNLNSVIFPVMNKIDNIKRGMYKQSIDKIISLLSSNKITIDEKDIQGTSALQAEYVFCRDGGVDFNRTLNKYNDNAGYLTQDILKKIYEEHSNLPEFTESMEQFAFKGRRIVAERLFRHCIEYCNIYLNLLEGELNSNYISYEHFTEFSEDILNILTKTLSDTFANAKENLDNIFTDSIDAEMDNIKEYVEKEVNYVISIMLRGQLDAMKSDSDKKLESIKKESNWLGDTIIYKKGGESTKAKIIFDELKNIFDEADFMNVQDVLFDKLRSATEMLETAMNVVDSEIIKVYGKINGVFSKMMNEVLETKNKEIRDSNFVRELIKNSKKIIESNTNLKENLAFVNSSKDVSNEFTNVVIEILSDSLSGLQKIPGTLDNSMTTSWLKKEYITYTILKNLINENFVPQDIETNMKSELLPKINLKLGEFQKKARTHKNTSGFQPLNTMQEQTRAMRDNLLENRGKDKQIIISGIKELYNNDYIKKISEADDFLNAANIQFENISPEDFNFSSLESKKNSELNEKIKKLFV